MEISHETGGEARMRGDKNHLFLYTSTKVNSRESHIRISRPSTRIAKWTKSGKNDQTATRWTRDTNKKHKSRKKMRHKYLFRFVILLNSYGHRTILYLRWCQSRFTTNEMPNANDRETIPGDCRRKNANVVCRMQSDMCVNISWIMNARLLAIAW